MDTIGQRIQRLRLAKGWAKRPPLVAELRRRGVKITAEMIRLYEKDESRPSPKIRAALAAVLGVGEEVLEFGVRQPVAVYHVPRKTDLNDATTLSAAEEILIDLFRGLLLAQQRQLLSEMRALFDSNNYTRRELGVKELKGVSDERVREAFGDVPAPRKQKKKDPGAKRQLGDAMGDFLEE